MMTRKEPPPLSPPFMPCNEADNLWRNTIVEFSKWSANTGWNNAALKYQFRLGMSKALKDELARVEAPASLENLIQLPT